jgi:hypothetical protein
MYMKHIKYLMAALQKCNLHSLRGITVFYYDIISIQLSSGFWIQAWTDISISVSIYFCLSNPEES